MAASTEPVAGIDGSVICWSGAFDV